MVVLWNGFISFGWFHVADEAFDAPVAHSAEIIPVGCPATDDNNDRLDDSQPSWDAAVFEH